eukprot:TRINITY_DN5471_c0_g1_i1.p1 TRINITY_DN5471_c0_g1~~TRINITY_DN5471_c0_g1_i1.p1  ORF type:complete len:641 (-),score=98.18 TRINITY_DN5471_c0_g1_i1:745-2667(-)
MLRLTTMGRIYFCLLGAIWQLSYCKDILRQHNFFHSRDLQTVTVVNNGVECAQGSPAVLEEYPYAVTVRNPIDRQVPNAFLLCGGVLIDSETILTSAACVWTDVVNAVPFNLVDRNPINQTFDLEFLAAVAPYCTHGNGGEVVDVYGYHMMEGYDGWPADGNSVALLKLTSPQTFLAPSEIPPLRTTPLPTGSSLTMVGNGARTNEQANLQDRTSSFPYKAIQYETITDEECEEMLKALFENKQLDLSTESCAVVSADQDPRVSICNGDDGNPLIDEQGNIAGVVTWWSVNYCEVPKDQTMPVVFADVSKTKVQDFIEKSKSASLTTPPNIVDDCANDQTLDTAPYVVSLQMERPYNRNEFVHFCGGVLIDNGKRVLTNAQCIWNEQFPFDDGSVGTIDYRYFLGYNPYADEYDYDESTIPFLYAALSPRCRHFNGDQQRLLLKSYKIHPRYNGNPMDGYDIAIIDLDGSFPATNQFKNFQSQIQVPLNEDDVTDLTFYGWGASFPEEARNDDAVFWNNYSPAKELPMELITYNECVQTLLSSDTRNTLPLSGTICAIQGAEYTGVNMCTYDIGGPLVGKSGAGSDMLVGLLGWQMERLCLGDGDFPEVFTDVREFSDFILSVISPEEVVGVARSSGNLG